MNKMGMKSGVWQKRNKRHASRTSCIRGKVRTSNGRIMIRLKLLECSLVDSYGNNQSFGYLSAAPHPRYAHTPDS